jgi:hypothetical protein
VCLRNCRVCWVMKWNGSFGFFLYIIFYVRSISPYLAPRAVGHASIDLEACGERLNLN